jgi:hypothetical protein
VQERVCPAPVSNGTFLAEPHIFFTSDVAIGENRRETEKNGLTLKNIFNRAERQQSLILSLSKLWFNKTCSAIQKVLYFPFFKMKDCFL